MPCVKAEQSSPLEAEGGFSPPLNAAKTLHCCPWTFYNVFHGEGAPLCQQSLERLRVCCGHSDPWLPGGKLPV